MLRAEPNAPPLLELEPKVGCGPAALPNALEVDADPKGRGEVVTPSKFCRALSYITWMLLAAF